MGKLGKDLFREPHLTIFGALNYGHIRQIRYLLKSIMWCKKVQCVFCAIYLFFLGEKGFPKNCFSTFTCLSRRCFRSADYEQARSKAGSSETEERKSKSNFFWDTLYNFFLDTLCNFFLDTLYVIKIELFVFWLHIECHPSSHESITASSKHPIFLSPYTTRACRELQMFL